MTNPSLWDRLQTFEIGNAEAQLTFAKRLSRENRWSLAYAERVIREYKRFLYLAMEAGHTVTPSEAVDQAWHLHLAYTRSYWQDLCRDVLGRELHHGPTEGGEAEDSKFEDLYQRTLDSYQAHFGEAPPADIWPPVQERFNSRLQWVDLTKTILIPKPSLTTVAAVAVLAISLFVYGCSKDGEISDGEKLGVFIGIGALFVIFFIFAKLRGGGGGGGGACGGGGTGCGSSCGSGCGGGGGCGS